jgi:hypothetical protein
MGQLCGIGVAMSLYSQVTVDSALGMVQTVKLALWPDNS